jgi:hypothetical protein
MELNGNESKETVLGYAWRTVFDRVGFFTVVEE